MKQQVYFITGTDTDVGKTYVTKLLLEYFNNQACAIGYKPVAAGATWVEGQWQNDDAIILRQASQPKLPYEVINPVCYPQAIAPHIASELNSDNLTLKRLTHWWTTQTPQSDIALIEGAGGWRLPLNEREYLSDFVKILACEVIVVVGMKLGCLNHALLTIEAIKRDGLTVKGWVANQLAQPMEYYQENLDYLTEVLDIPLLGEVRSYQSDCDVVFEYLDTTQQR